MRSWEKFRPEGEDGIASPLRVVLAFRILTSQIRLNWKLCPPLPQSGPQHDKVSVGSWGPFYTFLKSFATPRIQ